MKSVLLPNALEGLTLDRRERLSSQRKDTESETADQPGGWIPGWIRQVVGQLGCSQQRQTYAKTQSEEGALYGPRGRGS